MFYYHYVQEVLDTESSVWLCYIFWKNPFLILQLWHYVLPLKAFRFCALCCPSICLCDHILKGLWTLSYKPFERVLSHLQLGCSCGQRWTNHSKTRYGQNGTLVGILKVTGSKVRGYTLSFQQRHTDWQFAVENRIILCAQLVPVITCYQ